MSVKIELTLHPRKSSLDGLVTYDKVNKDNLDKIIKSELIINTDTWNEKKQLDKYLYRLLKTNNNLVEVKNVRSKNMSYGRVGPEHLLGLSNIRCEIRHTICKNSRGEPMYYDIDVANCHFVILSQVCNQNKIKCKEIDKYIEKREEYLSEIMEEGKIDRNKAKNLFIAIIYGASFEKWKRDNNIKLDEKSKINKKIEKIKDEVTEISKIIVEKNHDLRMEVEKNKILKSEQYYNLNASCMSTYLQEYECRILECMYTYLVGQKIIKNNITTLCSDGIMVLKNEIQGKIQIDYLMKDLEKCIETVTGFKIKLEQKEMNKGYTPLELYTNRHKEGEEDIQTGDPESYEYKKREFEKKNFKVLYPIMFATETKKEMVMNNKTKFKDMYENYLYTHQKLTEQGSKDVESSFVDKWLTDKNMRTYDRIDFLPKQEVPEGVYNTFKGFEVEKLEPEEEELDITESLIYKHLYNICNNDDKVFDYVLKLLSRKVKNPGKLTNTALLFKSAPGAGKDTFFDYFGKDILGSQYYFNDTKTKLLFGQFNARMENKILCVLNEVSYKQTIELLEQLKDSITTPINTIEHKGVTPYENKNHITYVMFTNNDNPIKIEVNDRRFVCIKCNDSIANDPKYFDALNKEIESKKYNRAFYDYLLSIDSDNYNFTTNRPETDFNKDLKEMSIPIVSRYLETLLFKNSEQKLKEIELPSIKLFNSYCGYLTENNHKVELTSTSLGLMMKKYESITKSRNSKGNSYIINFKKLEDELVKMKHIEPIPK
jgi:hypothetical protein